MFSCCLKEWHSMRKWFTDSHLWEHHLHLLYFRSYSLNRNESFSIHKDKWQHNKIISQAKKKKKFLFMMIKCTKHLQWITVRKHNLKKIYLPVSMYHLFDSSSNSFSTIKEMTYYQRNFLNIIIRQLYSGHLPGQRVQLWGHQEILMYRYNQNNIDVRRNVDLWMDKQIIGDIIFLKTTKDRYICYESMQTQMFLFIAVSISWLVWPRRMFYCV